MINLRDVNKPRGCPVRKTEPKGPLKGCEDCWAFKPCVEHTQNERDFEELMEEAEKVLIL